MCVYMTVCVFLNYVWKCVSALMCVYVCVCVCMSVRAWTSARRVSTYVYGSLFGTTLMEVMVYSMHYCCANAFRRSI